MGISPLKRLLQQTCMGIALLGGALQSNATLIRDTVECGMTLPGVCSQPSAVVGAGNEFILSLTAPFAFDALVVDVGDNSIRFTSLGGLSLGPGFAVAIGDLDWAGATGGFTSFQFESSGTFVPDATDVTLGTDSVTLDLADAFWASNDYVLITLQTARALDPVAEPSAIALLGLGLMSLGYAWRRRPQWRARPIPIG